MLECQNYRSLHAILNVRTHFAISTSFLLNMDFLENGFKNLGDIIRKKMSDTYRNTLKREFLGDIKQVVY